MVKVRDDLVIVMILKDRFDLPLSLQDQIDRMLLENLKRKLKRLAIGHTTYLNEEQQTLRSFETLSLNVFQHFRREQCSTGQPLDENLGCLWISNESHEVIFLGRIIIVHDSPENADQITAIEDTQEWQITMESLRLMIILLHQVV